MKIVAHFEGGVLSLGVAILRGDNDDGLDWPFVKMVVFQLVNEDGFKSVEKGFQCTFSQCSQQTSSSEAVGIQGFASEHDLMSGGFIMNDLLAIKALILPTGFEQNSMSPAPVLKL